jgi:hypothetical protein
MGAPAGLTCLDLVVAGIPPSGNHYKVPGLKFAGGGRRAFGFRLTREAQDFRNAVAYASRGRTIAPPPMPRGLREKVRYALTVTVTLGAGQGGDGDNFWKCIADSLQAAGVIHSDARVRRWVLTVEDGDRENPRTEIRAEAL